MSCLKYDAVPAILLTMKIHYTVVEFCPSACWALLNIAANNECREVCIKYDAVSIILSLMKIHSSVANVCHYACRALYNIGWSDTTHRSVIVAAGAIPVLVAVYNRHSGDAKAKANETLQKLGYSTNGTKN